jgi:glucose uptake protein GlcU
MGQVCGQVAELIDKWCSLVVAVTLAMLGAIESVAAKAHAAADAIKRVVNLIVVSSIFYFDSSVLHSHVQRRYTVAILPNWRAIL